MAETSKNPVTSVRLPEMTRRQLEALTNRHAMSMANVLTIAIDRMYQQEIQTMTRTTEPELIYSIPTNEDYYTNNPDEEQLVPGLLDESEKMIAAYLDAEYPGLHYEIRRVPETMSHNNQSHAYTSAAEEALAAVDQYVEDNWYNWWPESN